MKSLLVLCLLVFAGCQASTPTLEAVPPAAWSRVRAGPADRPVEGPARVLASPTAASVVTPPFRATVTRVRVREGDSVDAGAPLVEVVMPELLDAAGRSEGARVRLTAWSDRLEQLTAMRAEGLVKGLEVSEAAARVAEARADLQAARAVLLSAGLREADVGALLLGNGAISLRAPQAGVVTRLTATLGETRDSTAGPLVSLAGPGPVRVEARLTTPAASGSWVFIDSSGQRHAVALVARAPGADARDGTFLAWFEPAGDALLAGTLGRVELETGAGSTRFLVPATAIRRDSKGSSVLTRRAEVPVSVGRCEGEDCLVTGALTTDDELSPRPNP